MKNMLTEEKIEFYRTNGYLAIDGFLDHDELNHWRRITEQAVEHRLSSIGDSAYKYQGQDKDEFYKQVFLQCIKLSETHDGMREIMHDARLGEMAATLAGVNGIRIWHDQALFKPPHGNPTAWHLDNPYWSFHSRNSISIWVALEDATIRNGCMAYLPGTHKTATYENVGIGQNFGGLFEKYPQWKVIDPVPVPLKAGSCAFHNGLTAHAAGVNLTARPRRAMTCAYMPDGAVFNGNRNVLPEDYVARLRIGDPLDRDDINPLIWRD